MTAVIAMAVALGACGSDNNKSSSSSTTASTTSTSASGLSAETQKAVDAVYKGTFGEPQTSGPKPQSGKKIWLVMQSAQATDVTKPGQILDAAKELGWNIKVFDGKYDPDQWVSGVRQAIAAKADGIILYAIDCAAVKAPLQDARKAGIPTVGIEDVDCDQTINKNGSVSDTGQPGLLSAQITYPDGSGGQRTFIDALIAENGFAGGQVLGLTSGTKGKGKIIEVKETDAPITVALAYGFEQSLKKFCPDCTVVDTVPVTGKDIGPPLQDKVAQALTQHPEATGVVSPYGALTPFIAQAVVASGNKDKIYVMGGEGTAAEGDLIRAGRGLNAEDGYSVEWEAWASLDAMNRLFNGEKPSGKGFPSGLGFQLVDKDHNLQPKGQPYVPPVDFRAAYKKAWGG